VNSIALKRSKRKEDSPRRHEGENKERERKKSKKE
jgi:hypothetical protein